MIEISEQRLPGVGTRYELDIGGGEHVVVVERRDGRRLLGVRRENSDHLEHVIEIDRDHATALGVALTHTRFTAIAGPIEEHATTAPAAARPAH